MTTPPARSGAARPRTPSGRPSAEEALAAEIAGLSYEQARDELVTVVTTLEAGGTTLEDSLALWERGEALAARCQQWLDGARQRLDAVRATDHTTGDDDVTGTTERKDEA